ncbi:MAG: STAS domain-containing protein [Gammaproteobacteria bacterium]|nr:STAS domain-containing protein [Gammaproteobacteria bacterium]
MSVTATSNNENKTLTINIDGQFDFSAHPSFRNSYQNIDPSFNVIVNLGNTEYVDSAALGMLLLLDEHFTNTKIKIINTNELTRQVLGIAHFEKKFDIS